MNYIKSSKEEAIGLSGGAVGGALVGGILGGTVGAVVAIGKGIVTGSLSGEEVWKCCTAGAIGGASIGLITPF